MCFGHIVQGLAHVLQLELVCQPPGDREVIGGGVSEGFGREPTALGEREALPRHRLGDIGVAARGGHDRDRGMVLGGRAHHGRPTDVDLLDARIEGGARGNGVSKGIQVAHHQVEGGDLEGGELLAVAGLALVGKDAGMDEGVQGLHPPLEHLGEARDGFHGGDGDSGGADAFGRRTRGNNLHTGSAERTREILQSRLVVDRDQGTPNRAQVDGFQVVEGNGHGSSRLGHPGAQAGDASREGRPLPGGHPPSPVAAPSA